MISIDDIYEGECPYCDAKIRTPLIVRTAYSKRRGEYVAPYTHKFYCCSCCGTAFTTAKMMDENLKRAKDSLIEWKLAYRDPDDDD